jgi:malonyl-CoA/methylmalonyl-CoA synthetase
MGLDLLSGQTLPRAFAPAFDGRRLIRDLDGRWLTGSEVGERVRARAEDLRRAGLGAGDRVLMVAGQDAAYLIDYLAVLSAGMVAVPVNPGYQPPEVERIVTAASPAARLERGGQLHVLLASGGLTGPPEGPDAPALLLYTSGTTGAPKGALLSHGNLLSSARAVAHAWGWSDEDTLLLSLPLFHMHGLGVGVHGALVAGSAIVLRPGFDAGDVAEHAGGATMFFGVPAMYQRLLTAERARALSSMRLIVSGSAPLPAEMSEALEAACGQRPLERYGMTETVMIASNPLHGERRPGSVGRPLPGVSLRCSSGGEIEVRGPNVLRAYDGGAGADSFTSDGWFRTGDLGSFDPDGYLRIVGRAKELIISGGFNVYPREVEEVLAGFPGVDEVAVIGRPSERWGEQVTAVVVGDVDAGALREYAAARLAAYKVPKAVEYVDLLPRNALGKLVRSSL